MPVRADSPLRKITMNMYESDCQWLEDTYGHGWTERVRQHIHDEVESRKAFFQPGAKPSFTTPRRTLGDLDE